MRAIPILLFTATLAGFHAAAATFYVTDTNDTVKPNSLRGAILAANHNAENHRGINNTIYLGGPSRRKAPNVFRLTIPGAGEDAARSGDLDITAGRLTIIGVGSNATIDASSLGDRVFQVFPKANLTLKNLTVTGGRSPEDGKPFFDGSGCGGAIYNAGSLTLSHCTIIGNTSGGGHSVSGNEGGTTAADGGGIYNSGTFSAIDSQISGNLSGNGFDGSAGGNGGGIFNVGTSLLTECILSGNQSGRGGDYLGNFGGDGGSGGNGGGIFNDGKMILKNCVVQQNGTGNGTVGGSMSGVIIFGNGSAVGPGGNGGSGGGIYNLGTLELDFSAVCENLSGSGGDGGDLFGGESFGFGGNGGGIFNAGQLVLSTSTVSSNICGNGATGRTGGSGGGIYNSSINSNSLDLTSCTIALNSTGSGGNGSSDGTGGGVCDTSSNATVRNSLIALNSGMGPDAFGNFVSQGFNLIGISDGSTGFTNGTSADQIGSSGEPIDPQLGPLQMNGGLTPTQALLPGSPAINQGNSFGVKVDQRNQKRPFEFPAINNAPGGDGSDIGAFELGPSVSTQ